MAVRNQFVAEAAPPQPFLAVVPYPPVLPLCVTQLSTFQLNIHTNSHLQKATFESRQELTFQSDAFSRPLLKEGKVRGRLCVVPLTQKRIIEYYEDWDENRFDQFINMAYLGLE